MWGKIGANMIDGREVKGENREWALAALIWLPEYCQSLKDRGRSRVLGGKLSCSRNVGVKRPLGSQDGNVKYRVAH